MVQKRAILALILAIFLPFSSSNLIDDTCKQTPNYKVCASILKGDPKSSGTDVTGLALIMVDSMKSKSNYALKAISQLLKAGPEMNGPLSQCLKDYKTILKKDVPEAVEALTKGDPKFAEDATKEVTYEVKDCVDILQSFSSSNSLLLGINQAVLDVADIATSIVGLLL